MPGVACPRRATGCSDDDGVDRQAQRRGTGELGLVAAVGKAPSACKADVVCHVVHSLLPVEHDKGPAALGLVIDVAQHMVGLVDPPQLLQRLLNRILAL